VKAALLLSGGMDSLSVAWWQRPVLAITIDYGQLPAAAEVGAAAAICAQLSIEHCVIQVDCRSLGSGDMAGKRPNTLAPASDWWPYRNQLLITFAAMKAVERRARRLILGTVASDSFHRDGTPEFVQSISRLLSMQEGELSVEAPAIALSTSQLIKSVGVPRSLLAWAHSCHRADVPCGQCRGCNKYFQTWEELGHGLDRPG
jgi:7-cyano-7-deazaguanine synthase